MKINYKFVALLVLLLCITNNIFSLNIEKEPLPNPFPSEENLSSFEKITNIDLYDTLELDKIKVSLITITPGKPVYSWFGHSAIMVEQDDNISIVYDYGIFNFSSENFVENFMFGKMYYLLLPSEASVRFEQPIEDNRAISKVELNIPNNKKLDIVNFLNYNAQKENRTYLYDFYLDNCATRIRDILNWASDGEFKEWATTQNSHYSYRYLSSNELSRSYFVNWVLNSFLGENSDVDITLWESMFLPEYLESATIDFQEFNSTQTIINETNSTSTFNSFSRFKNHLILYTLIGLILGLLGLFFKVLKQDKELPFFGIYNIIINLFLFIISLVITFFVFYSNITAAWNNENIFFLNPIIFIFPLILSILTLSKKEFSMHRVILYEIFCSIYSFYLVVFIIIKNIIPETLIQDNYIIIVPLFLFYVLQGALLKTKN
ncbi:MAG: DUF4105 domain-containing protein [Pleomorphochaeta sp.]